MWAWRDWGLSGFDTMMLCIVAGMTSVVILTVWAVMASSNPDSNRFISNKEKAYIRNSLKAESATQSVPVRLRVRVVDMILLIGEVAPTLLNFMWNLNSPLIYHCALSVKMATTRCHWSKLDLTRWSHGVNKVTKHFFKRNVMPETSCLHYLLPDKRDISITGRLRHARTFQPLKSRTVKFRNSFISYCLDHYV